MCKSTVDKCVNVDGVCSRWDHIRQASTCNMILQVLFYCGAGKGEISTNCRLGIGICGFGSRFYVLSS